MSNILPIPDFFDPGKLDQVWRVPYEERARQAKDWALRHGLQPASPIGTMSADQTSNLADAGGRAKHLLHPRLRAVRRRPQRDGGRGRQPPPVRVHLPQFGDDYPHHCHHGHAQRHANISTRFSWWTKMASILRPTPTSARKTCVRGSGSSTRPWLTISAFPWKWGRNAFNIT